MRDLTHTLRPRAASLRPLMVGAAAALCCCVALPVHGAPAPAEHGAPVPGVLAVGERKLARILARITPGITTKSSVRSLLGAPWRTVQYNDMERLEDEIWEYRGKTADGGYRVHIEFDAHDVVRLIGRIPDPGGGGAR